jgi:hypothetical protein
MRRRGVTNIKSEPRRYDIRPDDEDGFIVKVMKADGTSTVTQFRTLEEANAWIDLQKRRDEEGELTI